MKIYCITGPMASGKNAAADFFERRGFACLDADKAGHQAVTELQDTIVRTFQPLAEKAGVSLLNKDGSLNRKALGSILFADEQLLKKQEEIVYPRISDIMEEFVRSNSDRNVIINAAVLYKIPFIKKVDKIIYIDAPFHVRFIRAFRRDRMNIRQILDRFSSQRNLFTKYKNSNADIERVWNAGSKKSLEQKLEKFL